MTRLTRRYLFAAALAAAPSLFGQTPPAQPVTTQVLAILTVKEGIPRDQFTKVMPDEVKATVNLYLEGKIQQWYARGDGKGVVFIMNCTQVDDARALTDTLPLSKAKMASFDFMPLGPLTPLRFLMGGGQPPK